MFFKNKTVALIFSLVQWLTITGQQLFFRHYSKNHGLYGSVINAVEYAADGTLWVSSDKGLFRMNQSGNHFSEYRSTANLKGVVIKLSRCKAGKLWVSDSDGRVAWLEKNGLSEIEFPGELKEILNVKLVDQLELDSKSGKYISTVIDGAVYEIESSSFRSIGGIDGDDSRYFVTELDNGALISGLRNTPSDNYKLSVHFNDGIVQTFTLSEDLFHHKSSIKKLSGNRYAYLRGREILIFNKNGILERKFCPNPVEVLEEDDEGKLWVGFSENGLHCYPGGEVSSNNFSRYFGKDAVYDIAMDDSGDLWFATSSGLFTLPKLKETVYEPPVFSKDIKKAVEGKKKSEKAITRLSETSYQLAVPGENNAVRAVFSAISINNKDTSIREIYQLPYNQHYIGIEFTGMVGNRPEAVQFKYQMTDYDSTWVYSSSNKVLYPAMEAGTYTFYLYAQNREGVWSESPAQVSFIVNPPFWRTNSFYALVAICSALAIVSVPLLVMRVKRKKRRRQEEIKKQVMRAELQALRAQMNPHFTFNTLSSIQNYIARNDSENASKYLSKFSKLMRVIMENSKQTDVPLEDEIKALNLYLELESLRLRDKFEYSINIDPMIDLQYTRIPSMLIQPYVENAIWHGISNKEKTGHLKIRIEKEETNLKCTVDDDGIGRVAAMKISERKKMHISQGMSITRERLELMNSLNKSALSVNVIDKINGSKLSSGTRVEIFIPLMDG